MLILGQMVVFFLMIFAGALARRYNIIIPNNQEQFSSLIVNIACPSLIISAAMHAEEHMGLAQVIETYTAYAVLLAMMCIVGFLLPLILRFRGRLRGAVNLSCDVQQAYSVEQRGGLGYRNAFAAQDSDDFGAQ